MASTTTTVSNKVGDQSGTSWVVTSSPLFSMLGKENKSSSAIMWDILFYTMWIFWKSSKKLLTYKHLIIVSISNYIIIYIIQKNKVLSFTNIISSWIGSNHGWTNLFPSHFTIHRIEWWCYNTPSSSVASSRWWITTHSRTFSLFRFPNTSTQGYIRQTCQSLYGRWDQCVDRHGSYGVYIKHCGEWGCD